MTRQSRHHNSCKNKDPHQPETESHLVQHTALSDLEPHCIGILIGHYRHIVRHDVHSRSCRSHDSFLWLAGHILFLPDCTVSAYLYICRRYPFSEERPHREGVSPHPIAANGPPGSTPRNSLSTPSGLQRTALISGNRRISEAGPHHIFFSHARRSYLSPGGTGTHPSMATVAVDLYRGIKS